VKVLLDTNAYSALLRGRPEVAERVRKAECVLMSTIVVGELIFGFRNGARLQQNLALLESFLANRYVELVPVTFTTADRFGRIAASLRAKGCPIPTNDIWVAAHTMAPRRPRPNRLSRRDDIFESICDLLGRELASGL